MALGDCCCPKRRASEAFSNAKLKGTYGPLRWAKPLTGWGRIESLRILQIYEIGPMTGSYGAEGVGSLALEVSKRLAKKGHEMWILTGAAPGTVRAEEIDGVHIERTELMGTIRATCPTNLKLIRQFSFPFAALKEMGELKEFDIYHGHIYSASFSCTGEERLSL